MKDMIATLEQLAATLKGKLINLSTDFDRNNYVILTDYDLQRYEALVQMRDNMNKRHERLPLMLEAKIVGIPASVKLGPQYVDNSPQEHISMDIYPRTRISTYLRNGNHPNDGVTLKIEPDYLVGMHVLYLRIFNNENGYNVTIQKINRSFTNEKLTMEKRNAYPARLIDLLIKFGDDYLVRDLIKTLGQYDVYGQKEIALKVRALHCAGLGKMLVDDIITYRGQQLLDKIAAPYKVTRLVRTLPIYWALQLMQKNSMYAIHKLSAGAKQKILEYLNEHAFHCDYEIDNDTGLRRILNVNQKSMFDPEGEVEDVLAQYHGPDYVNTMHDTMRMCQGTGKKAMLEFLENFTSKRWVENYHEQATINYYTKELSKKGPLQVATKFNFVRNINNAVELITTKERLIQESVKQHHCVATYFDYINHGDLAIVHYKGYTAEIAITTDKTNVEIRQFRGRYNVLATQELALELEELLNEEYQYIHCEKHVHGYELQECEV